MSIRWLVPQKEVRDLSIPEPSFSLLGEVIFYFVS